MISLRKTLNHDFFRISCHCVLLVKTASLVSHRYTLLFILFCKRNLALLIYTALKGKSLSNLVLDFTSGIYYTKLRKQVYRPNIEQLCFVRLFIPGYQYRPPSYPYLYKMAPVYSWYQRDENPAPAVEMEPNSEGNFPAKQMNKSYSFLGSLEIFANEPRTDTEGRRAGEDQGEEED